LVPSPGWTPCSTSPTWLRTRAGGRSPAPPSSRPRSAASCPASCPSPIEQPIASLNLYATRNNAFAPDIIRAVGLLGAYGGLALAYRRHRDNARTLAEAIDSNRCIGAAIGILMGWHRLAQDQAFSLLRRTSQNSNRKLGDIADDVLHRGDIPR